MVLAQKFGGHTPSMAGTGGGVPIFCVAEVVWLSEAFVGANTTNEYET